MAKQEVFLIHPAFEREEIGVTTRESSVDTAGYRSITQMVDTFTKAGIQLEVFRAAEFTGDMELNPMHRNYIDPVDRDNELARALERAKKAKQDFEEARKQALDKKKKAFEDEVERLHERIRRNKDALVQKQAADGQKANSPDVE